MRLAVDEMTHVAHTGDAEIVGLRAEGQHQRVVGHPALAEQTRAVRRVHFPQHDLAAAAIQPAHAPDLIREAMAARMRQIGDLRPRHIAGAGCNGVQHRLPQMRGVAVDERHARSAGTTQRAAQAGRQHQAGNATTDDHDSVSGRHLGGNVQFNK